MIRFFVQNGNKDFLRLWVAQLISQFGDRIHQLALIGLIAERSGGSALGLAKLMTCTILPVFIVQPFAGVLVDRLDRRTTLFVCDIFRGLLVLTIPFLFFFQESMIPIYVVVFLVFCFSRFYVPAKMAIIPDLVSSEHLLKANSLITTTGMIAAGLGAAFGAYIIEYCGARNGFIIDAFTFFISAVFLFFISVPWRLGIDRKNFKEKVKKTAAMIKQSFWGEMREGFQYLFQHKEIRFVVNTLFILFSAAGSIYIVIIVFIQESFHSVTKHLGGLAVMLALGLFIGVYIYGNWGKKSHWYKTIFICLFSGGVMLIVLAQMIHQFPNVWVAGALTFAWGLTIGPIFVASNTIVHVVSDEKMRGKVFSSLEIVIHLAFLISMFLTSWLSGFIERVWILSGVGIVCALVGIIGTLIKPKIEFKGL